MLEDMQLRNLSAETQRAYVRYVSGLAQFYQTSPEQLGLEESREYSSIWCSSAGSRRSR